MVREQVLTVVYVRKRVVVVKNEWLCSKRALAIKNGRLWALFRKVAER